MKQLIQSFFALISIYQNYVTSVLVKGLVYLLLLLAAALPGRVWGQCNPVNDRANLIALYNATGGSGWTTKTNWNTGAPISTWYGVTTNASGCVTRLDLFNNNLIGSLPSAIGSLNNLVELHITFNEGLTGAIPPSIVNLSQLEILDLGANNFTGNIPISIGNLSKLRMLTLEQNDQLTGSLPTSLGNIPSLEEIWIGADNLTGQIPSTFGNLSNLTTLVLVGNNLSGCIPATLQNLCPHVTLGLIGGNPNLATQDWDNFCNFQEGMCAPCNPYTSDISSDVTICQGESANLTFNFSAGTPPYTVTWTGGTLTNIQDGHVVTVTPATTKTYKVITTTDAVGCTSTSGTSATVSILTAASVTISNITGSISVCQNATTIYSVPSLPSATSYTWSVPAGAIIQNGQGTNSISVKWSGTTSGNVCVYATNQCGDGPQTCKAITVKPAPVVNLSAGSTCGTTVILDAANPGSTYKWSNGPTTQTISVSTSGTYTVTVTNAQSCSATGSVAVVVQPAIQIGNIITTNLTGSFIVTGGKPQVNGSNYASVTMALQGNPAVTASLTTAPFTHNETVSFTCPQAGTYVVTATDAGGCSGTGMVVVANGGGSGGNQSAGGCWTWLNPSPQGSQLNDVFFVNAAVGWAVGNSGTMLKTNDGGTTWQLQNSGTKSDLFNVQFIDAQHGWIRDEFGIFMTVDGGNTWMPVAVPRQVSYFHFTTPLQGLMISTIDNVIYSTMDGGGKLESNKCRWLLAE